MFDKIYLNVCVLMCVCVGVWRKAENKELMGKTSNGHTYTRKKGRITYRAIWVVFFVGGIFIFGRVFFVFAVLLLCLRLC